MSKKPIPLYNQDFDPRVFLLILKRNIWAVALIFAVTFLISFLYLRYSYPKFHSMSSIQLTSDELKRDYLQSEQYFTSDLAKELELLRSPVFLNQVLESLPLDVTYFKKGSFVVFNQTGRKRE